MLHAPTSLVTGGAGFLGSHVVDELLQLGHRVVVVDDLSGGFAQNVAPAAHFVQASILDRDKIEGLFVKWRFDYVYHLAAYAAEGLSHFIRRFNYENNLLGSINLINAAVNHQVKCFVFTSSIAVYGTNRVPMRESDPPSPKDPYGIAKYAVELDLIAAHQMFGLESVVFRPHNIYGERQNIADKYRNVVGIFMNRILRGESLPIFGDGEQKRAFSYISDVAPTIANCVNIDSARNQVFNIGADEAFSVNSLGQAVSEAFGVPFRPRYLPARNEVAEAYASHEKLHRVFGSHPGVTLGEGIGRMAEWARLSGPRQSGLFKNIEIEEKLPPSWRDQREGGL